MSRSDCSIIVLLEDSALDAELVTAQLRSDGVGLVVERAKTEPEFIELLSRPQVALVLSDFSLPTYDGLAALERVRSTHRDLPFIFVSGAIGEDRAIETIRRGATDYVLKHRLERLGPAVRRALDEAETRRLRERAEHERDQLLRSERQAREAAEAANRMKDEFLAIVSHELRTPLNAILGWASLLSLGNADEAKLHKGLDAIARNARIQARIIDDILDVSRIVSGKLDLHRCRVHVGSFVLSAVDSVRPSAVNKDITIEVDVSNEAQELEADGERLQQVIWNLVNNAVKFTASGGRVLVRSWTDQDEIVMEVSDTGSGIAPELLPHVFEAFRQGDASKTRVHSGLGLGLAIVKHLVTLHGGSVEASSELGRGSTFTVRVPLRASQLPAVDVPSDRPPPSCDSSFLTGHLDGVRVLLVDDEPEARDVVSEVLRSSGAEVCAVGSVSEALESVVRFGPDAVVSDIGMPLVDGYSLARKLRTLPIGARGPIPAIALTAYARDVDRCEAKRAGYQRHLAKPVSPAALVQAGAEVVGRRAVAS